MVNARNIPEGFYQNFIKSEYLKEANNEKNKFIYRRYLCRGPGQPIAGRKNGTLGFWGSGSRAGTGRITINLANSTSQTPYAVLCRIPPGGKLVTYTVDEF